MNKAHALTRRYFDRVWRSRFARNVVVVASGTAGSQAITMAFAPLITRIYGPEAFGLLGTFTAMVAITLPVAALAYPIAIVLPRADSDALGLVRLSAYLSFSVAILVTVALWLWGDWLIAVLGVESIGPYILLIPVAMLFSAWMQIVQQWIIRKKEYGVIARAAVTHSLILNSAKTGIGWFYPLAAVLIAMATIGHALHAGLLTIGTRRRYNGISDQKEGPTLTTLRELAHRHRDFPLYRAPQNFINAISQSMPILLLAALDRPVTAGFYALGKMVLSAPLLLVAKSVGDVFYPKLTEAYHKGVTLAPLIIKATASLGIIGVVPFGMLVIYGPTIFEFVFGSEWRPAGEYSRWLAIMYLFGFMNTPAVAATATLGLQIGLIKYEIISTGLKVIAMYVGLSALNSDIWAVALFGLFGALSYVVLIGWVYKEAKHVDNAEALNAK